ncbi:MAG: outer membrane protein transport protein [Rikenellaceae bacterium]
MKRFLLGAIFALTALSIIPSTAYGQYSFGGAVLDHDIMMPTEIASLSQNQPFGTARSMAMGGAFTSLGGDMSTVSINPAGLGMFSQEVFSLSPMLMISDATTAGAPSWQGNNKSSFGFSNMGATFKVSENASGSVIAVNAAVTYNRLADYNSKMSFSSETLYNPSNDYTVPSIVDVYMGQLDFGGFNPDTSKMMDYDNNPYYWPAQSAYNTYLVDPVGDGSWTTNTIGQRASVMSSYDVTQRGRADEYSFALGANIGNYLYIGATLGLQQIVQTTEYTYQEEYNYYEDGGYAYAAPDYTDLLASQAAYSVLWQKTKLDGAGANLKLGMIMRPMRALRIGIAYHSPTYYTMTRSYETSTEAMFWDNSDDSSTINTSTSPEIIDNYEYSWKFRTPSKLLLGASLQVGSLAIVSLDYERQWYNWIRVSNAPGELTPYDYQSSYETNYQPTNTLRAGLEVKPMPTVALRAGAGYVSSMLKDESQFSTPMATDSHYISLGLGFQLSSVTTLDLAYQNYHQNYSSYQLFYVENGGSVTSSNTFNTSLDRNYVVATLTFRM